MDLEQLKKWAEHLEGSWDGDESGLGEDRAHCAHEIIEKVNELQELLDEMSEYGSESISVKI